MPLACSSCTRATRVKLDMFITDIVIFSFKWKKRRQNENVKFFQERRKNDSS